MAIKRGDRNVLSCNLIIFFFLLKELVLIFIPLLLKNERVTERERRERERGERERAKSKKPEERMRKRERKFNSVRELNREKKKEVEKIGK